MLEDVYEFWKRDSLEERKSHYSEILNIRTPKVFPVITLKFEQDGFSEG